MAEDKISSTEQRERITRAWLVKEKAEQHLGRSDIGFYDLPLGWQYQVTRENSVLWPLDGEAMKQTLNADSPFELIEDRLRVGSKFWLVERLEKLATLAIESKMDENAYAEECEKLRAQARRMYKEAELVRKQRTLLALDGLDNESVEAFKAWRGEHTHPWDKALDEYCRCRQELIDRRGYGNLAETEAIVDFQLGLQSPDVVNYVRWMIGVDWKLDLGPKARWLESLRAMRRSNG